MTLGQLMALNAADGPAHGLPGPPQAAKTFAAARVRFKRLPAVNKTEDGFIAALKLECFGPGKPFAPGGPPPPASWSPSRATCVGLGPEISTVVGAETVCRLMSDESRRLLASAPFRINVPITYPSRSGDTTWIGKIASLPEGDRQFKIQPGKSHGRPLVWFTRREEVEGLRGRVGTGGNFADLLRDYLGLIHHGPALWNSSEPNHLFALHYSSSVALDAGHSRPSVIDGIDNRRFKARTKPPKKGPWGKTVDLDGFKQGGSERVLLSLQEERFVGGATLTMEYIGVVSGTRGLVSKIDDDPTFVKLVGRRRDIAPLIRAIDTAAGRAAASSSKPRKGKTP
jgi:hypothetical protein